MKLLELPAEIRLQILQELLAKKTIKVEAELLGDLLENNATWSMRHLGGLYPTVLRTCRQLLSEGQSLVFTGNVFDCSQREGTTLLVAQIGTSNFAKIKHLVLDWDQIQDMSWTLAKDPNGSHFAGVESVEMATWRTRTLGGTSMIWRQNKRYELQLCHSAIDILQKHPKLVALLQRPYRQRDVKSVHSNNNARVKWRFVSAEQTVRAGELVVDLEEELVMLRSKPGEDARESEWKMDPF